MKVEKAEWNYVTLIPRFDNATGKVRGNLKRALFYCEACHESFTAYRQGTGRLYFIESSSGIIVKCKCGNNGLFRRDEIPQDD
jgi:RNase P subunit RPR2